MRNRTFADLDRVVALGGGHGLGRVMSSLSSLGSRLTGIVTTTDNGGSTGRIRRAEGGIAWGDMRNCLNQLITEPSVASAMFEYRFGGNGELSGHNLGNLMLKALDHLSCAAEEDKLADDVDVAIFYGRGNWPGLRVEKLYAEYLLPVCSPLLLTGEKALKTPADLAKHTLLHDASRRDWQTYTRQLGLNHINVQQGPIFSHSAMVLQAAIHGQGVALANNVMAQSEIEAGRLVCPFNDVLVSKNAFYLVCHDSQAELGKIAAFRQWILAKAASEQEKFRFRYEQ
jgi:hypothetical protein